MILVIDPTLKLEVRHLLYLILVYVKMKMKDSLHIKLILKRKKKKNMIDFLIVIFNFDKKQCSYKDNFIFKVINFH